MAESISDTSFNEKATSLVVSTSGKLTNTHDQLQQIVEEVCHPEIRRELTEVCHKIKEIQEALSELQHQQQLAQLEQRVENIEIEIKTSHEQRFSQLEKRLECMDTNCQKLSPSKPKKKDSGVESAPSSQQSSKSNLQDNIETEILNNTTS